MTKIIQNMFYSHNGMNLNINNRRKFGELMHVWKLNITLPNKQVIKKQSQGKLENTLR